MENILSHESEESSCIPQCTVQNATTNKYLHSCSLGMMKKTNSISPLVYLVASGTNHSTSECDSHSDFMKRATIKNDHKFESQPSRCLVNKDPKYKNSRVRQETTRSVEEKIRADHASEIVSGYIDLNLQHSGSLPSVSKIALASNDHICDNASQNGDHNIFPLAIDQTKYKHHSAINKSKQPPQSNCGIQNLPQHSLPDLSLCASSSEIHGTFEHRKEKDYYNIHPNIPKMRVKCALKIPNFDRS